MLLSLVAAAILAGCGSRAEHIAVLTPIEGGDADVGRAALSAYGCSTCHTIPGVTGANGRVAPSLEGFGRRAYIGGATPNTPEHLVQWIMDPKSISPNTLMPNLNVGEDVARDIAAYLQTLR
ncbi:MAG: cytochrome c family protein [Dehalococcoidia bacterium]